jgi:hypothetical protein
MAFNLSDYQTVQERIEIFWKIHPTGRIVNKLIRFDEKTVIVRCSVWKDTHEVAWKEPDAVDYAQEPITEKGINATSALENCTTSATGRALSLLGGELSPSKARASRTEMEKVARARNWVADLQNVTTRSQALSLLNEAKSFNADPSVINSIIALGKTLAENEKNPPVGKEETTDGPA